MDINHLLTPKSRKTFGARIRRNLLVACLAMAVGSQSEESKAQWMTHDATSLATTIKEYAEQATRWVKTVQHYKDVVQHYADQAAFWQQQLVKLKGMKLQMFELKQQFKEVAEDYGLAESCPGSASTGFDITTALHAFLPDMNGDVVAEQNKICELLVRTKNKKYNISVKYFNFIAEATTNLEQVHSDRLSKVSESMANLSSILTDTQRYSSNLDTAGVEWETNMSQLNLQTSMLEHQQAILARRAMNGRASPLGTLVNTLTLKAAFTK